MGSTGILDPVNQTGSPIQSDFRKIGTINGPASSGDTPPSSDSGVHSLGEQWENMSTNYIDMESEQNERPSYGSTTGRRVSDTSVPPNTEECEDIDYPWTDRLLESESDDISSIDIQQNDRKVQFNKVTIYVSENSMVHSGTVWPRPRTNIVGWSPRYGECRPDTVWAGSASGRGCWPSSLVASGWAASGR